MKPPRFVQIHSLTSYPATLLNRDDAGMAKRLPFGGTQRARVSSQSLKRKWRFAGAADHAAAKAIPHSLQSLGLPMGERSKDLVRYAVLPRATVGLPLLHQAALDRLAEQLNVGLYGKFGAEPKSRQALFFGDPETAYVVELARSLIVSAITNPELLASAAAEPDKKALRALEDSAKQALEPLHKNLRALALNSAGAAGLESALFGRMVTSDPSANVHAPVHVAHAFSVHAIERELDYVTAVDDLRQHSQDADPGSAGIFDLELTSGLYYGYVTVDLPLLVSNLSGNAALAAQVVERLVQLIARTSPGAKRGSTAPYSHAEFLLVETGDDQPRTLANAFRNAIELRGDVFGATIQALQEHLANLDRAYGQHTERHQVSVTPPALAQVPSLALDALCVQLKAALLHPPDETSAAPAQATAEPRRESAPSPQPSAAPTTGHATALAV
jgi:CRISPR system Cascade subunit CasC